MVLQRLKLSSGGLPLLSRPELGLEITLNECRDLKSFLQSIHKMMKEPVSSADILVEKLTMIVRSYGDVSPIKMSGALVYKWPIGNSGLYCMLNMTYKDGEVRVYKFQLYRQAADGNFEGCGFPILTFSVCLYSHNVYQTHTHTHTHTIYFSFQLWRIIQSLEYFVLMTEYVAVIKPGNLDEALGIVCDQQEEDLVALNEWLAK